jgi:hypothetical protein
MSTKLPYVAQPGSIVKIFEKVRPPESRRFTGDFLGETRIPGGNYMQFIPLAKKLGFLGSDGRPTDIYRTFRNNASTKAAMAQALKAGYREVFERNEHADALNKEEFKGMVVEITGLESKSRVVQLICQTFESLRGSQTSVPPRRSRRTNAEKTTRHPTAEPTLIARPSTNLT